MNRWLLPIGPVIGVVLYFTLTGADRQLAIPLLLGIAYAASIGGLGTPINTPPNLIFMQVHGDQFGPATCQQTACWSIF